MYFTSCIFLWWIILTFSSISFIPSYVLDVGELVMSILFTARDHGQSPSFSLSPSPALQLSMPRFPCTSTSGTQCHLLTEKPIRRCTQGRAPPCFSYRLGPSFHSRAQWIICFCCSILYFGVSLAVYYIVLFYFFFCPIAFRPSPFTSFIRPIWPFLLNPFPPYFLNSFTPDSYYLF